MSKAERTRAFIIEKTAPIFNMKGYAGTSLSDMTEATGLTKGSIYGNFANKDEVALAVFDYNLNKLNTAIVCELVKYKDAKSRLLVYVTNYKHFFDPPFTAGGCPILNTAVEADDTHPYLKDRAAKAILSWKKSISRIIQEGIEKKEIAATIDIEQFALTMISMIEGGIMIAKLLNKKEHLFMVMRSLKKMILELK